MGSSESALFGALLSSHVATGDVGHESSNVTRSVVRSEMNIALFVTQLTPTEGSPASVPLAADVRLRGGEKFWKRGAGSEPCGAGPSGCGAGVGVGSGSVAPSTGIVTCESHGAVVVGSVPAQGDCES